MKIQIILLDTPIIVSDESKNIGDKFYHNNEIILFEGGEIDSIWIDAIENGKKIIAGLPKLPQIDFNGFEEQLGIVDVEKLAEKFMNSLLVKNTSDEIKYGFIEGFKATQKLNEKNNILEDLNVLLHSKKHCFTFPEGFREFQKSLADYLSKPKVFDIEIEMEEDGDCILPSSREAVNHVPKITNNSIKIIRIL